MKSFIAFLFISLASLGYSQAGTWQYWTPPQSGGGCTETKDTLANILALSGSYQAGCLYTATDISHITTCGTAEFSALAIDADSLSDAGHYESATCNVAHPWDAVINWQNGQIQEITDSINGNYVLGDSSIANFPFNIPNVRDNSVSNANLTYTAGLFASNVLMAGASATINGGSASGNVLNENSRLTLADGAFNVNTLESAAIVNVTDGNNVNRNLFSSLSNTTVSGNGNLRDSEINSRATVIHAGTGNLDQSTIGQYSNVTLNGTASLVESNVLGDADVIATSCSLLDIDMLQASYLLCTGGSLARSTLEQDADFRFTRGSHYDNVFGASTYVNQVGTGTVRYSKFYGTPTVTVGNVNFSNVYSDTTPINTTGSTGSINNTTFERAVFTAATNIASLTILDSNFSSYCTLSANSAARVYLYRTTCQSSGSLRASASRNLDVRYSTIGEAGYVEAFGTGGTYVAYSNLKSGGYITGRGAGRLTVNYGDVSSRGFISSTATGANTVTNSNVSDSGRILFQNSATNNQVLYSTVLSFGYINIYGTSTGATVNRCLASSGSQIQINNSVNARLSYCTAQSNGIINSQGNTATHYLYYVTANSGTVQALNNTGTVRMYRISANSQGIARLQNSSGGNWYHSEITSYYYAFFTIQNTATVTGIHASGRRTHTFTFLANTTGTATYNY